jgi:predicted TPR repeat methyltransferase
MVQKAKLKNCYSSLHHQEAVSYLTGTLAKSVDLIVASDVFIYVGNLNSIFNVSYSALKSGGALIFTVEELELIETNYDEAGYVPDMKITQKHGPSPSTNAYPRKNTIITSTSTGVNTERMKSMIENEGRERVRLVDEFSTNNENGPSEISEHATIDNCQYWLLSSGRFGHSEKYITSLSNLYGFEVKVISRDVLRLQSGLPVKSITFVLLKQ